MSVLEQHNALYGGYDFISDKLIHPNISKSSHQKGELMGFVIKGESDFECSGLRKVVSVF